MYTYTVGIAVGKSIQHSLEIEAESFIMAKTIWAFQKTVVSSKHWNSTNQTYKGHELVCTATNDPSTPNYDAAMQATAQVQPKTTIGKMANPTKKVTDSGVMVDLPKSSDIPDWELQKTKISNDLDNPAGFPNKDQK